MSLKDDIEALIGDKDFIGVEWLEPGVVVSLKTVTRASIDVCQQVLSLMMKSWPLGETLTALFDFPELGLTPYLRQKMNEVRESKPVSLKCRLGIVIPSNSLGYIMYLYWNAYPQGDPSIEMQMFESREAGLAWMKLVN